jgi:histidinol-phosphate aminotransferase
MSNSGKGRALPHIYRLDGYTPGKQPRESGWIKLNTNESPYPPSPKVREAIINALNGEKSILQLYPDPRSSSLRNAIAQYHRLSNKCVIAGNGSDDILNLLIRTYCNKKNLAATTNPNYSLYPVLTAIQNSQTLHIPMTREMKIDVNEIAAIDAKIILMSSPNAPTGVSISNDTIAKILKKINGILVIDEAYAPFADHNAVSLLADYPNLIITRTLSKAHGLAGLRVGYALAAPEIIELMDRVRESYNLDRLAQIGAEASILDDNYNQDIIAYIKASRGTFLQNLSNRGWFTYPSQSNFVFTEPKNKSGHTGPEVAISLLEFLEKKKILIRYFSNDPLTSSFLRISIGLNKEMQLLNEAIDEWTARA